MDTEMSSERESSGDESSAIDYDVFLSFRGPDTRQGFTDCLYHLMLEANIRAFFDEEVLHVGKEMRNELPTAIKKSKIYIPIFSKCYASSPWCLKELAHMVECKISKPSEKEIMPIFYDVEPHDVKLRSQLYNGALDELEEKFGPETREKWEDALTSVAQIKGWELKKQGHWKFIKSVIQEIVMKLKTKDKYVTQHLVGMDDQVEAVLKLMDVESGGLRFVLIHGMGGIGKTTLAKIVFNKLNSLFVHCCFLRNVRESSVNLGLVNLQNQLLSDILGSAFQDEITDVDDGIKVITQQLSNRKVFIILDDVGDVEQIEKLAINHILFGSGSRVVMTTRNKNIIEADKTSEYEVKPLNFARSLELFSRHAFGRNRPPDDYLSLSKQVVATTGRLPLALEVIGSLLHRQNKASWIDVLDNLREIPHEKVQDKLKISYNVLSHEQKQIFLDIACLFMNKEKTNAFYMWKDCGYGPDYSTQVLVCMSLIKITDDNKFWMHDQLRDLGRKIVRGETRSTGVKQSRLWVPKTALNVLKTEEKKKAIEAISLDGNERAFYTGEEFSMLPNLRFLRLRGGNLVGDFKNQFSSLRYLSWNRCPNEFSAINLHPSNLVILNLSSSRITKDWGGWSQLKVAEKLKILDLSYCKYMTRTPDFSNFLSLERLILKDCPSLVEVDGSLGKLKNLVYLNANYCSNLMELPEGIRGFEKLRYLNLGNCTKLRKLPESFVRGTSLVELDLSNTAITVLSDSIGNQKHLSVLKLQGTKIDILPSSVGNLQELKSLVLSFTEIRELPTSIGNLESLIKLDVSGTHCLQLPESIGHLSRLKVINVSKSLIRKLPRSILELTELEELHADHCSHLKWEIPENIWKLSYLRVLSLEFTPTRHVPHMIKLLSRLKKLGLRGCSELKVMPKLPTCLTSLSFGSTSLQCVKDLSNLTKLADLSYGDHDEKCSPLFSQNGPSHQSLVLLPPSLSKLSLESHQSVTSLSFRCNLRKLKRLRICRCLWMEVQLDGLDQLTGLEVESLTLLKRFAGLSSLKRLKLLTLIDCPNLTAIEGLGSLESLEQFEIRNCHRIGSLEDLSELKKLKSLEIRDCEELLAVKGLDELETLKSVALVGCRSLRSFRNTLKWKVAADCTVTISDCPNLEDLSRIRE